MATCYGTNFWIFKISRKINKQQVAKNILDLGILGPTILI